MKADPSSSAGRCPNWAYLIRKVISLPEYVCTRERGAKSARSYLLHAAVNQLPARSISPVCVWYTSCVQEMAICSEEKRKRAGGRETD